MKYVTVVVSVDTDDAYEAEKCVATLLSNSIGSTDVAGFSIEDIQEE